MNDVANKEAKGVDSKPQSLSVLTYLQRMLEGSLRDGDVTHMNYPTAISQLLGMKLISIDEGSATLGIDADASIHGNQQKTVHGGLIAELADAAIGTAHSTLIAPGMSFASIELSVRFLRPVWQSKLRALATSVQRGKTISQYQCDIYREDGKLVATAVSSVMTLQGESATGR